MKNGDKAKTATRRGRGKSGVPDGAPAANKNRAQAQSRVAGAEVAACARIKTIPEILKVVSEITQMRFAAVARVTNDRWTACAALDLMDFGIEPGRELEVATTLCSEVRDERLPIVIEHASQDHQYSGHPSPKQYGIESYIAVPIILRDDEFFGTLCALDSRPAKLSDEIILGTMKLFAELIAAELSDKDEYLALAESEYLRTESENRVRAVTDAMPGLISYIDPDYRYKFVNHAYSEWFGIEAINIIGRTISEVLGEAAFERLKPHLDAAFAGKTEVFESEIPYRLGGTRFVRVSYTPDLIDGKIRGIFVLVVDVSDAKRAEAALRNSEERYRAFIGRSSEGIWRFELDEPIPVDLPVDEQVRMMFKRAYLAECNDALARQYGYESANDLKGARLNQFLIEDDTNNLEYLLSFAGSGYTLTDAESHEKDIDGNDRYFLNNLIGIVENGVLVRAWGTQRDVTESKKAQIAIDRYRILSMQARDTILFIDRDSGRIVEANEAAVSAYGYARDVLLGMNIRELRAPESHHLVNEQFKTADEKGIRFETVHVRSDGTRFPVEVSSIGADIGPDRFLVSIIRDISDRRASEDALNQNQMMLRLAMQSSRMGVWERDLATETVWWSEELEAIFGLERGGFAGTENNFYELMHEDDREAVWAEVERAVSEHRPYAIEFRFYHADGSIRWMEGRGEAVYSEKGEPVRLYGIGIDISDRKAAERALRESEERLRLAVDISQTCTFDIDLNTDKVETDDLGRAVYGWETDEPITFSKVQTHFHPDDKEYVIRRVGEAFDPEGPGEFEVEHRIIRTDGEIRWIRVRGRAFFEGKGYLRRAVRCLGTYIDITDRKRAEERVTRAAEDLRLVTDSVPALISYVDKEQRFRFNNKVYEQWFGYKPDNIRGKTLREVLGDTAYERVRPYAEAALAGERLNFEAEIPYRDGGTRFIRAEYVPDVQQDGTVAGYYALASDVSERKRAEADREFLLEIAETIRRAETEEELITNVVAEIGRHLEVSRSLFMEVDPKKGAGIIHNDYCTEGLESLRGTMPLGGFSPVSIELLRTGHTLVNNDTRIHPRTAEFYEKAYKPLGMDAFVGVPLLREGKWVSLLGVLQNEPRYWTPAEVSLLEVVAERAWLAVEKLRGEATLREANERFRIAEEASHGFVYDWDLRTDRVTRTAGFGKVLGYEPGEIEETGEAWRGLIHPDDLENVVSESDARLAQGADRIAAEYRVQHRNGSWIWVLDETAVILDPKRAAARLVGSAVDITERKRAELALHESEERFSKAFNSSPLVLTISSLTTGELIEVNDTFVDATGFSREEAIGRTTVELGLWARVTDREEEMEQVRRTGQVRNVEYEFVVRDGSVIIGLLSAERIEIGGQQYALTVIQDVTERRRTELNQEFLFRFGEIIRENPEPDDLVEAVSHALGQHICLDRCFFNQIDKESDTSAIRREYRRLATATPMIGTVPISSRSPITRGEIEKGKTIVVLDVEGDPRTAAHADAYLKHGIRSYIAVPLTHAGEWAATLVASTGQSRNWAEWEIRLVQTVGDRTWGTLERRAAETALQESEERYRAVVESQSEMLCRFRVDGTILFVNTAYARARGTAADELLTSNFWNFIPAEDQPSVRAVLDELTPETPEIQIENHFDTVEGERWTLWTNRALSFDVDGRPLEIQSSGIDITERKLAEEKIRESEERYRNLADAMPQLVWTAGPDGSVDYFNSLAANYEGIDHDETTGRWSWEQMLHPDDRAATEKAWREAQKNGKYEFEHRVRMKDGSYRWHLSRATLVEDFDARGGLKWFGTATDIHENKLAQVAVVKAERRAAEEYFEMLSRIVPLAEALGTARDLSTIHRAVRDFICSSMRCSAVFISFFHPETRLRTAAYAWGQNGEVDISLLPPIELTENGGPNSQAVYQRRSVIVNRYMEEMKDRPHIIVEEDGINPNSSLAVPMMVMDRVTGTIEVQAYEVNAFDQEHVIALEMVANLAAVAIENVRLIEIEAKARQDAEAANRMKDEFLSILSHELRTPLNAMLGWVRMLRAGILDEERSAKAMEVIERNTRQQSSLIEDLLDVSRIISGKMRIEKQLIDVAAVVTEVADSMRPLASGKNIAFEFRGCGEPLFINGDSVRLHQVVTNLIQNAIKFTPSGGRIEVSISEADDWTSIVVRDTGVGIGPDFLPHIFDRFSQADASTRRSFTGLGLGLTIVRTIVELHGGRITAESEGEKRGSAFTVTLPLSESFYKGSPATDVGSSFPGSKEPRLKGLNVLVVDDDLESVVPLQVFLERENASVATAASAAEAQSLLGSREFDLLISDIGMPTVDGYEFMQDIRRSANRRAQTIPAIALTAYVSADDRQRAIEAGFQEHVSKPLDFDALMAVIKRLIKNSE